MERGVFEIVDTESLVPANHLLRKIDAAVDFGKTYDMVEPLYCADNGRPSVNAVVLFEMVLIQQKYAKWVRRDISPDCCSCIISLVFPFFRTNSSFA